MFSRTRRVITKVARPDTKNYVTIEPLVPWQTPARAKPPNIWPLMPKPFAGPQITIDRVATNSLSGALKTIELARKKYRQGLARDAVAFQHTALPELLDQKNLDAIAKFFQNASTNFKSIAEMKRAAVHLIKHLPADEASQLAQRLCELPNSESYGIDIIVLNQLAIVLFKHHEPEKAQTLMKAIYVRNKKPSVHVYIAMIEFAIQSRQLPLVLTAYSALRSAQVAPTPLLFRLMWQALVIARRTLYRLRRPRDVNLPHLHPVAAPFSVWTLPSEEAMNSMVKTLIIDMDTHKIRTTNQTFESRLEFVSSLEDLNAIKKQIEKLKLKQSKNLHHAIVRACVRLRRTDLAVQHLTTDAWEPERSYLEKLNANFASPRHKTLSHEFVESSYLYGLFDSASREWAYSIADHDLQRKRTILAVMKASATSRSALRLEQVTKRLSSAASNDPVLLKTVLRALAPVSRDAALAVFLSIIAKSTDDQANNLQLTSSVRPQVFNDAMLALVNATDFRSALLVYKLMLLLGVKPNLRTFLLLAYTPSSISHLPLLRVLQEDMNKHKVPSHTVFLTEISRRMSHLTSIQSVAAMAPIDDSVIRMLYGDKAKSVTPTEIIAELAATLPEQEQQPADQRSAAPNPLFSEFV